MRYYNKGMLYNGKEVSIEEWPDLSTEDFHDFKSINLNLPEDTPTAGYRIVYKSKDDKYYSPLQTGGGLLVQQHPNSQMIKDLEQQVDIPIQSPSKRGFYYWADKDTANDYLSLVVKQFIQSAVNGVTLPEGELQVLQIEGIAAAPDVKDEGNRVKEMIMYSTPISSISYKEISDIAMMLKSSK